ESAQVKVEGFFFDQRKRLVEFDDVMNKHREIIYKRRRRPLEQPESDDRGDEAEETLREQISGFLKDEVESLVATRTAEGLNEETYQALVKDFVMIIPFDDASQKRLTQELAKLSNEQEITERLLKITEQTYDSRQKVLGKAS